MGRSGQIHAGAGISAGAQRQRRRRSAGLTLLAALLVTSAVIAPAVHASLPSGATITVSPFSDLPDSTTTTVNVDGEGLYASSPVQIQQCEYKPGAGLCDGLYDGTTDANGDIDEDVPVSYQLPDNDTCDSVPGSTSTTCTVLIVYTNGSNYAGNVAVSAPLTFAGHDSAPAAAALTVTPNSGAAPLSVVADASASTAGSSAIVGYAFSWGDGTTTSEQSKPMAPHTFVTPSTTYQVVVTVFYADQTIQTAQQTVQVGAAVSTATRLALDPQGEPVDTQVNETMTRPGGATAQVLVDARNADGSPDPTFTGPVTLSFAQPNSAEFVTTQQQVPVHSPTLTANAVAGVASFSPIVVDMVGFGDTLVASAPGLTQSGPSTPFDVAASAVDCPPGTTCTVSATSPGTGQSATVTAVGGAGSQDAIITASFGGNVAPLHGCTTTAPGILTFNGNRQKVIKLTVATTRLILKFCYAQPTPFIDITLHNTAYFSVANGDYEGILGPCIRGLIPAPCISGLSLTRTSETVTVTGGANDPHMSH